MSMQYNYIDFYYEWFILFYANTYVQKNTAKSEPGITPVLFQLREVTEYSNSTDLGMSWWMRYTFHM